MKDINNIDLRHLLYFVTVAEQNSFSRAAEHLNMAQPPLSQQIKDLEYRIGAALFIRANRKIILTEAGRALLPEARDILLRTKNTLQRIQKIGQGQTGMLRIGLISTAPYNPLVQNYLSAFARKYPDVELDISLHSSIEQRAMLMEDALDLGFHWPWAGFSEPDLETHSLAPQGFCLALPRNHPLAKKSVLDPALLQDERWLIPRSSRNPGWHAHIMSIFTQAGFRPRFLQEKDPAPLIMTLIAAGQGVAVIPDFMEFPNIARIKLPKIYQRQNKICMALTKKKTEGTSLGTNFFKMKI